MSAQTDLLEYLAVKSEHDTRELLRLICRLDLQFILYQQMRVLDKDHYHYIQAIMHTRKTWNDVMESELRRITSASESNGIRIVCIKGLVLATEVYEPREMKSFGDIDADLSLKFSGLFGIPAVDWRDDRHSRTDPRTG